MVVFLSLIAYVRPMRIYLTVLS